MAKTFKGRVVVPGTVTAKALVSHGGFNTLASYQSALMFGDKDVKCGDQNNPDIYKKPMIGVALCLPQTIGSTTGGMVFYTAGASWQAARVHVLLQAHRLARRRPAPSSPTYGRRRICPLSILSATSFSNMSRPA